MCYRATPSVHFAAPCSSRRHDKYCQIRGQSSWPSHLNMLACTYVISVIILSRRNQSPPNMQKPSLVDFQNGWSRNAKSCKISLAKSIFSNVREIKGRLPRALATSWSGGNSARCRYFVYMRMFKGQVQAGCTM